MQESTFYQAITRDAHQEGRKIERFSLLREIVPFLQGLGVPIELILKLAGVMLAGFELEEGEGLETGGKGKSYNNTSTKATMPKPSPLANKAAPASSPRR